MEFDGGRTLLAALSNIDVKLGEMDQYLDNLLELEQSEMLNTKSVNLLYSLAYSKVAMLYVLLKMQGVDTRNHQIQNEINAVRSYKSKVRRAGNEDPDIEESRKSHLSKVSANRFVQNLIGERNS